MRESNENNGSKAPCYATAVNFMFPKDSKIYSNSMASYYCLIRGLTVRKVRWLFKDKNIYYVCVCKMSLSALNLSRFDVIILGSLGNVRS